MTTALELELPLFRAALEDARVTDFVSLLYRIGEWVTATEACAHLGLEKSESNRRLVRTWAEAAGDEIISGQHGYRHADRATTEEVHHFCAWMDSQAQKMKLRAARTRARAHAILA